MDDNGSSNKPVVLLVDDNKAFLYSTADVLRLLQTGNRIVTAENAQEAEKAILELTDSVIVFMDLKIGERDNGSALLRHLKSLSKYPFVSFFISGDRSGEAKALREGVASGFITKPVPPDSLIEYIRIGEAHIALILSATRDPLTDVLTRSEFEKQAVQILGRAKVDNTPTTIIFADIDDFSEINDKRGHDVGDKTMVEVAKCLSEHLRPPNDILGRYSSGADEFVILLPHTDEINASAIATRIKEEVRHCRVEDGKGGFVAVTVSLGVQTLRGEGVGEDLVECLNSFRNEAENAMREAKVFKPKRDQRTGK